MNNKNIILILFISLLLSSCKAVKDTFVPKKSLGSDEFLVEKKSPLVMPPDFNDLPLPKEEIIETNTVSQKNKIQSLIKGSKNTQQKTENTSVNKSLESLVLEKIKK